MRVFRDIGRYKAYKRRYGENEYALSTFLLQRDDPLLGVSVANEGIDDLPVYSLDELYEMGNADDFELADENEPRQLLLSIFGRIYDVTKGVKFYGTEKIGLEWRIIKNTIHSANVPLLTYLFWKL